MRSLIPILLMTVTACSSSPPQIPGNNNLTYAVAWKQPAAEQRALYYQGFNLARLRVQQALERHQAGDRPLAIVTDVDETLLLATDFWGYMIRSKQDFFNDTDWDNWVRANRFVVSPGALEFMQFCQRNAVTVYYVTSRDQGEDTLAIALENLKSAGFPQVDSEHVTVLRDTSNKEAVQRRLAEHHDIVVYLGDNLNDFSRRYYLTDIDERAAVADSDHQLFGQRYILFPNPTDGHWIRAIFGDSEPPPTAHNRRLLRRAATRKAWRP